MMPRAAPHHAAHVEQVQLVARRYSLRHVADETFQRTPTAKDAHEYVARINLREPAGR